ncbi:galectin-4-like [Hippocampus zosterae]|uniref:galectin-4-like n=1 Tax=Hippocampus zosterae TaxID=109293 RepID=UPI00223CF46D|nr:galectin-4-like [Hippocampus zosterae]
MSPLLLWACFISLLAFPVMSMGYLCPSCPVCPCDKCPCPSCPPCRCPKCRCATCAPPTTCPPLPPMTCPPLLPMTTCPSLPTCPPPQLPTSGPGNWSENPSLTHVPDDIKGLGKLLVAPHPLGFRVDLLGLLSVGSNLAVRGRAKPMAERLIFKLAMADDTALHLGFRINEKTIMMSSDLHGTKSVEEKEVASFPFQPGQDFEMIIQCDIDRFHVTVDSTHQLEFIYRDANLQSITALRMWHDVLLRDVRLM